MLLARIPRDPAASESALKREIVGVVRQVAAELRNTPAVCRKSYINPVVFDGWRSGAIHGAFEGRLASISPRKAEMLAREFLRQL
jgi:DNA topoisomerase I